jgi:cyanophycinase
VLPRTSRISNYIGGGEKVNKKPKGSLIIIGGHEDKDGDATILTEVSRRANESQGSLVIVSVASSVPEEMNGEYIATFKRLGVHHVEALDLRTRADAHDAKNVEVLVKASVVFFTGGDQLRITSQIGDSPVYRCMRDLHTNGGTIVGTSAGAAAMSETMLIAGPGDESNRISALDMAPGLGLIQGVVIDSHFAERGRMGRLLGAVAQNPKNLGVGIDENTAIVVEQEAGFRVIGSGAVYVLDGCDVTYSTLSDKHPEGILSVFDVRLHVLGHDDCFDLAHRRPVLPVESARRAS